MGLCCVPAPWVNCGVLGSAGLGLWASHGISGTCQRGDMSPAWGRGRLAGQGACMSLVCRWGRGGGVGSPLSPVPLPAQEVLLKRAADLVEALYGMPHSNQVPQPPHATPSRWDPHGSSHPPAPGPPTLPARRAVHPEPAGLERGRRSQPRAAGPTSASHQDSSGAESALWAPLSPPPAGEGEPPGQAVGLVPPKPPLFPHLSWPASRAGGSQSPVSHHCPAQPVLCPGDMQGCGCPGRYHEMGCPQPPTPPPIAAQHSRGVTPGSACQGVTLCLCVVPPPTPPRTSS